jgi:integrase
MAGRRPVPWYRKGKGEWCVYLHGTLHRLGKDKDEAFRKFHRMMADGGEPPAPHAALTFRQLVEDYLADLEKRATERTVYVARCYLKPILVGCGDLAARQLRKHHVEAAVRKHGRWNATTENHVKARVVAVFNWAVNQELLASNPVKGLKKPKARSRGTQALLDGEEHAKLLESAPGYLRDVLVALHDTGARPCEVLSVTAAEFFPELGVWVLETHKTAHETGKARIVYLTPRLVEVCRELAARHPEGPLFRRRSGKPFPPAYYLARLVRQLRRKLGLRETITPYGLRHSFATDALAAGVPDAQVAELLGHSGTAMLHKHYSHLTAKARALRGALDQVRGEE